MFKTPDDVTTALSHLPAINAEWRSSALARQEELTKPPGSLGRLEELAVFLAGWGQTPIPVCEHATCVVFAGNHGVTRQGISPYPASVTEQMVANFQSGGAAINAIAAANSIGLKVVPLSLDKPTDDISETSAMSTAETLEAMSAGADAVEDGVDILTVGEMGIGNSTVAAALSAAAFGGPAIDWVGPGTGLTADGVVHKAKIVDQALARYRAATAASAQVSTGPGPSALAMYCELGGRELAAIAGAVIAARLKRVPVILDGFISTAAIAPLYRSHPAIIDHVVASHVSAEPAHAKLLDMMHLNPLLDLQLRLGEGTGAALAVGIVRSAVAAHNQMATFAQAGVAEAGSDAETRTPDQSSETRHVDQKHHVGPTRVT
ncbi:MAG: nicotinate-nucleotide--dimethylbenzimidazole phosphoribosyltransferase [Pseudomonadota bacterium]